MTAKLTFVFASMNSGKTLALLTKAFMLREKGYFVVLMKPELDDRTTTISSRIGLEESCTVIPNGEFVLGNLGYGVDIKPDYILIDEAQFLSKDQVWDISDIVDYFDVNVICYGLKLNWQAEMFEGSKALFELSDELIQLDTYCRNSKLPALFHNKISGSNSEIEPGYDDMYESVSRRCWKEKRVKG